jgi:hypothetical protein
MNPNGLSFFAILIFLMILITIPGVIMGWVAAGRIRRSEGKLYGMRFAAFAALFFPILAVFILPFAIIFLAFTFLSLNQVFDRSHAILFATPILAIGLILGYKFSQSLYFGVTRGEPILAGFRRRLNSLTLGVLAVLLVAFGSVMYIQRPKPVGNVMASQSTGGAFKVEASTWHRRWIFRSDELCYRFEIVDQRSGGNRAWEIPVKSLPKWSDNSSPSNDQFGENGSIHWKADNSEVVFKMDESDVFTIATDPIRIPPGAHVAGTGEIRVINVD